MNKSICVAWMFLCACSASSPETARDESRFDRRTGIPPTILETTTDVDRHGGEWLKLTGRFEPLLFTHATITLESGLVILIPDFDRFKSGDDWLKYSGHRVAVGGKLVSYPHTIGDRTGPALVIDFFEPLERIR